MSGGPTARRARSFLAGLVALPVSVVPFLAYLTMTPEGRLVRDRVMVAVAPPVLPRLSSGERARIQAAAPRYRGGVMVLGYHGIGSASDGEGGYVLSTKRFGEHLTAMRAAGMTPVTVAEVARSFSGGPPLPPNAVAITFDDGRTDAMLFADPLLAEARMKATMFVITGAAERPGVYYASWKALKDRARSGRWDIQSHTAGSHREHRTADSGGLPMLTSLAPGESLDQYRDRVRADLTEATEAIERQIGTRPTGFAYPFGAYGADRTNHPAIAGILREEVTRQYAVAFHQDGQEAVPLATKADDPAGLRRLEVGNWSGRALVERIADAARRSGLDTRHRPPPAPAPPTTRATPPEIHDMALPNPTPAPPPVTARPASREARGSSRTPARPAPTARVATSPTRPVGTAPPRTSPTTVATVTKTSPTVVARATRGCPRNGPRQAVCNGRGGR